ncbi:hypothetical protein SAMN05443247_09625 [Bradyrhizobium erythrophlei]|nr:hypothetical protein SAMN05443247_09625 [Bradyrhizobium erythrophlei]
MPELQLAADELKDELNALLDEAALDEEEKKLQQTFGKQYLSLSQTLSGWQLIENRAMLLCHEGSLQAYWLDGRRSDALAGSA